MKNLNKKIGAVALAGMVIVGGFAVSGRSVQAAPSGGGPSISNKPNVDAHRIVKGLCDKYGIAILVSSIDHKVIDAYVNKKFKGEDALIKRLSDLSIDFDRHDMEGLEEYLEDMKSLVIHKDKSAKRVYRIRFGPEEYLIFIK